MGQIVVNVGGFDLTSHNGNTAYSTPQYFNIPENAGITACVATFSVHVNTGSFQGKAFFLNGALAHPSAPWPISGIALNPALLSTGQNTFRASIKSQAGLSARWSIGDIYLTITYNESGGGSTYNIGSVSVNKTSLVAGDSLTVSLTGGDSGIFRDIYIQKMPSTANIMPVVAGQGSSAGVWTVTIPESWCETLSPNDPSFELRVYLVAYIAGGSVVGDAARMVTVNVPSSAIPTISDFTAALNANGVDASITEYVQNYSKSDLEIVGAAGALGSSIESYEITGAGWSSVAATATFGPFTQTGNITFMAKVTDTRGRTVSGTVTINVLPYTPVSGISLAAYRSDASGDPADEGTHVVVRGKRVFSLLGGQNVSNIRGRVFEKNTTPPGWTSMVDDTPILISSLSIEKGYTVQISIDDKITSVIYIIEIPTSIVGIHILPGATGGGFGMYGRDGCWDFKGSIFSSEGVCPGIGDILITLNSTSPATRFPDTTWAAIEGMFLIGADSTYVAGSTGGSDEHEHTLGSGFAKITTIDADPNIHLNRITTPSWALNRYIGASNVGGANSSSISTGTALGGSTDVGSSLPPFKSVYIWERTA